MTRKHFLAIAHALRTTQASDATIWAIAAALATTSGNTKFNKALFVSACNWGDPNASYVSDDGLCMTQDGRFVRAYD